MTLQFIFLKAKRVKLCVRSVSSLARVTFTFSTPRRRRITDKERQRFEREKASKINAPRINKMNLSALEYLHKVASRHSWRLVKYNHYCQHLSGKHRQELRLYIHMYRVVVEIKFLITIAIFPPSHYFKSLRLYKVKT